MWLLTTQGFYSVVAHRDDADKLLVRTRTREDIEALREQIPALAPFEDAGADYRHRAVVSRPEWMAALAQLITELDYDNFKNAVAARQAATAPPSTGSCGGSSSGSSDPPITT